MTYVLLIFLMTATPRTAMWSAEFSSRDKCEAAGQSAVKAFTAPIGRNGGSTAAYVCVEK